MISALRARLGRWSLLGLVLVAAAPVSAAPPEDWSIERSEDDPALVRQRLRRLHAHPFGSSELRALSQAVGREPLLRRVRHLRRIEPHDPAWAIVEARLELGAGRARQAAAILTDPALRPGKLESRIFDLRLDALVAAGAIPEALAAISERIPDRDLAGRKALLSRGAALAERRGQTAAAVGYARALAELSPEDPRILAAWGKAAAAAGLADEAEPAFARALRHAAPADRDRIAIELAKARVARGEAGSAASSLWERLRSSPRPSASHERELWDLLLACHRRAGSMVAFETELADHLARTASATAQAHRALADARAHLGRSPISALRDAVARSPRDLELRSALVLAEVGEGHVEPAVAAYRAAGPGARETVQLGIELANRLIATGEHEAALAVAEQAERRAGRSVPDLLSLVDFYNAAVDPDLALAVARRAVALRPRDPEARVALGEQLYQRGEHQAGLDQWKNLPGLMRPIHAGWARYAELLGEHGHGLAADQALAHALALAPDEPRYLRYKATLAELRGRGDQALPIWKQVRERAVSDDERPLRDEARTRIVELLVRTPSDRLAGEQRGAVDEARTALDRGEPLADAIEAGRFLVELHTRNERIDEAIAVLRRLCDLQPGARDPQVELAASLRRGGHSREAIEILRGVAEREPGRPETWLDLTEVAFEAGDLATASAAAQAAAADGVHALVRLGELHERRGELEAARTAYERALAAHPADPRARLRLATVRSTLGDLAGARAMFRSLLGEPGPADVLREAGRRALALAEADGRPGESVALAMLWAEREPDASEARELLLDALDRTPSVVTRRWLGTEAPVRAPLTAEAGGLRRVLLELLGNGPVRSRLRAAEHLGHLRLPDTAVPLARLGVRFAAPRDSTRALQQAYLKARIAAIGAAAELRDAAAIPVFAEILQARGQEPGLRHAAARALVTTAEPAAAAALAPTLREASDEVLLVLSCMAQAIAGDPRRSEPVAGSVTVHRYDGSRESVRQACAWAEAALTPDHRLERIFVQLEHADPLLSAIAAWRLGRVAPGPIRERAIEVLLVRFVGPPSLARDAAGAAIARLLATEAAIEPTAVLPAVEDERTVDLLLRWLRRRLAPPYPPLDAKALAPHRRRVAEALARAERGTRAQRLWAGRARHPCAGAKPAPNSIEPVCLAPLVAQTLELGRD